MGHFHQPQAEPWDMQEHNVEQLEMAHAQLFAVTRNIALQMHQWSPFEKVALQKMKWPSLFTEVTDDERVDPAVKTVANLSIQMRHKHTRETEFPQLPVSQACVHAAFNALTPRFAHVKADLLARGLDATIQHRLRLFAPGTHHKVNGETVTLTEEASELLRTDCLKLYVPLRTWYDRAITRSLPLNNQPIVG